MFFTEEKLARRIAALRPLRYRDAVAIETFQTQLDPSGHNGEQPPTGGTWSTMRLHDRWEGIDSYLWLRTEATIPAAWQGRTVVGLFDFGTTGPGNNHGFESLVFVNGTPYQGVDSNHQEVFFEAALAGHPVQLDFRLWSGLGGMNGYHEPQVHMLSDARLAWLDEATDDLYYTADVMLQAVGQFDAAQPERTLLLTALDKALLQIDWRDPASDSFYASVAAARDVLHSELNQLEKYHPVTIHCLGHTHIDVAWLWRLRHTREKTARSLSTVLRLMERYPDYVFLQTQPQLFDYLKADYPEVYAQIKQRVAEGRFEVDGGMWLEADCNLTSGESLVRQILMGSRFLKQEFGVDCEYLWLPDVFGYSWALPQILRKSGLSTFMTTKISWNQYNRMPHDTFWWRGIDGTEILTHFITTPPEWAPPNDWRYVYEGDMTPKAVLGSWAAYRDKSVNQDLLVAFGFGDGGGGVNRDMLERRRRIDALPGLPRAIPNTARNYFRKLHETVSASDGYIHTWDGELYLEYHRGTYTSQAENKRANRKLELLYRQAEWLAAFASVTRGDWVKYPQAALTEGWKILLRNQFHDIIPGSSIHEVYEDSRAEYGEAKRLGEEVSAAALGDLTVEGDGHTWTVCNPSPWIRSDLVTIPAPSLPASGRWLDGDGCPLTAVHTADGWQVQVPGVPAMGLKAIRFVPETTTLPPAGDPIPFTVSDRCLETPFYRIAWNPAGQLTELFDLAADRPVLAPNQTGNVLQVFEDKPLRFDAWDIDLFYQEKGWDIDHCTQAEVVERNALRAVIRFVWTYQRSTIRQEMVLYADHRRIDFETRVDWHEQQQLLKVAFPVHIRATEATYDIQFGNVKRPTHWNTSWDAARFESVGHQWADLSEMGYGVSLMNDCKYGYDIRDNVMRLSLIKSAIQPDRTADQGEHRFTYALYPHIGDWLDGNTVQSAFALNAPFAVVSGAPTADAIAQGMIELSSDRIMIDAVKKSEDGSSLILRLHDFSGGRQQVRLHTCMPAASWQLCDFMERPTGAKQTGAEIELAFAPYEIHTVMLTFGE